MPFYTEALRGVRLSEAQREAMAVAPNSDAILYTLEIDHADLAAPIRLVLNDRDITARLESDAETDPDTYVTFTAISLGIQLPEESDSSQAPSTRFWIDGVSALVASELEVAAESLDPVTLAVRTYISTDLSGPSSLPPLRLELRDIEITETRVTASAAYADFGNTRFPAKSFTIEEYPGLSVR